MATYPLEIWTIRSYVEQGYSANTWCHACRRWLDPPDLPSLLAQGHGDRPLRDLGLACPYCGNGVGLTIRPTPGFGHQ